jgi:2-aminoadipate transaminase
MQNVRRSFVREILKAAARPEVISFAGGLPHSRFIPVAEISQAIQQTLATVGAAALQYCTSEGHPPLRQWIADQYNAAGMNVSADQILITTGSQQGFDLLAKVLLEPGDRVVVEEPTYIAALQSIGLYEPIWSSVPLDSEGAIIDRLSPALVGSQMFYCMTNFQNPSGISYSAARRAEVASLIRESSALVVEDDPYGLLRYEGTPLPPLAAQIPERTVLLGTFSKILAPGMRIGWLCAPPELMEKLIIAKQALDLCSENLGQWVLHQLVTAGTFQQHIQAVCITYGRHCRAMITAIKKYLPSVQCTEPTGGMFVWVTLPKGKSALELFQRCIEKGVAFVPGQAFYPCGGGENTMRLNFTNSDEQRIEDGVKRIAASMWP